MRTRASKACGDFGDCGLGRRLLRDYGCREFGRAWGSGRKRGQQSSRHEYTIQPGKGRSIRMTRQDRQTPCWGLGLGEFRALGFFPRVLRLGLRAYSDCRVSGLADNRTGAFHQNFGEACVW